MPSLMLSSSLPCGIGNGFDLTTNHAATNCNTSLNLCTDNRSTDCNNSLANHVHSPLGNNACSPSNHHPYKSNSFGVFSVSSHSSSPDTSPSNTSYISSTTSSPSLWSMEYSDDPRTTFPKLGHVQTSTSNNETKSINNPSTSIPNGINSARSVLSMPESSSIPSSSSAKSSSNGNTDSASSTAKLLKQQEKQRQKWLKKILPVMLKQPSYLWAAKIDHLRRLLFQGIPDDQRCVVWQRMLGLEADQAVRDINLDALAAQVCGCEHQIDLDVIRTLREHVLFRTSYSSGQQSLFKMLVAFANAHVDIGYCQGMSSIGAVLLIYLGDERLAYAGMLSMFRQKGLDDLYASGFPLLYQLVYLEERLMAKHLPAVHSHFAKCGVEHNVYAIKWHLSLFLCFPHRIAMRVWDLFFYYGTDIFVVFVLAVLGYLEQRIVQLGFEPLVELLCRPDSVQYDVERLFDLARKLFKKISASKKHSFAALKQAYLSSN